MLTVELPPAFWFWFWGFPEGPATAAAAALLLPNCGKDLSTIRCHLVLA
jgi:hypothetical protein